MLGRVFAWSALVMWLKISWHNSTWFRPVVIAAVIIAMIVFAHGEYLEYAASASANRHVLLSFALKWGAIALTALTALAVTLRRKRRKKRSISLPAEVTEVKDESAVPSGVDLDHPRSAAERILDEKPR